MCEKTAGRNYSITVIYMEGDRVKAVPNIPRDSEGHPVVFRRLSSNLGRSWSATTLDKADSLKRQSEGMELQQYGSANRRTSLTRHDDYGTKKTSPSAPPETGKSSTRLTDNLDDEIADWKARSRYAYM